MHKKYEKCYIFVPGLDFDLKNMDDLNNSFVIAVDQALEILINCGIRVDLAVGDFDSLKNQTLLKNVNHLKFNSKKDFTDTYLALKEASKYSNNLRMIGGVSGNRIEHFVANLNLFDEFKNLEIITNKNRIFVIKKGRYELAYNGYISFFNYKNANISLEGFKYPLLNYELKKYDSLCISNEIINNGEIIVNKGKVLVILSQKDEK